MDRIVIIGAGIGGVQAASSLADQYCVTLINGEDETPYYRMRIEELLGSAGPESIAIHPDDWYCGKGIRLIHGRAVRIEDHQVYMETGESIPFEKAVIATGAEPRILPLKGNRDDIIAIRRIDDVLVLKEKLEGGARSMTIIGGGLLGLEAAAAVREHFDVRMTVLETADFILPNQLDAKTSGYIQSLLAEKGIEIVTGARAEEASDDSVILSDGRAFPSDILCISAGVIPDISLASASGIKTGRGIIVDNHLSTSMPDVFAIGDAAELDGRTFGLAMHAREMGSYVASEIRGAGEGYKPSDVMTQLKVAGISLAVFGSKEGNRHEIAAGNGKAVIFEKGGTITGIILVEAKQLLAKAKGAIGKSLESFLASVN